MLLSIIYIAFSVTLLSQDSNYDEKVSGFYTPKNYLNDTNFDLDEFIKGTQND